MLMLFEVFMAACLVGFLAGVLLSRFVVADAKGAEKRVMTFAAGLLTRTKSLEERLKAAEAKIAEMVK